MWLLDLRYLYFNLLDKTNSFAKWLSIYILHMLTNTGYQDLWFYFALS